MVFWLSLNSGWKLQDVQAGLNVSIAFICAGATFVFVRYFWQVAARRVIQQSDVPAYTLLSLNSIGEILDVVLLLRRDLFTRRYWALLVQCVFVVIFTIATMMAGFLARFSTRYGTVTRSMQVNGTLADRSTGNILYAEVDTNRTMQALQDANWPLDRMLEYLPNDNYRWNYVPEQWNSSWSMDCSYNRTTPIPNVATQSNCSSIYTEIPFLYNNFWDWSASNDTWNWQTQSTGWRANRQEYRSWVVFSHGIRKITWDNNLAMWTEIEMRTVMTYLAGVPWNTTVPDTDCNFAVGPIKNARYTSANCRLKRKTAGRTKDDLFYGAYPEGYDVQTVADAYLEHFGNTLRKAASRNETIPTIEGEEATRFWLAWQITKDTITSPYTTRSIDVKVQVPQISLICVIIASIVGLFDLCGLLSYWLFLFRNWQHLEKTPQSKLDWMMKTLKHSDNQGAFDGRQKLDIAMASGHEDSDGVLLNRTQKYDSRSLNTNDSFSMIPEPYHRDDGFETYILESESSSKAPSSTSTWFPPQQYERVSPHIRPG